MHADRVGNVRKHQRLHGFGAVVEEAPLVLDDAGGDLEQRLVPGLDALQKPARFLKIVLQELIVGRGIRASHHRGVIGVDAQAWRRLAVQLHQPAPFVLANHHVRNDVLDFFARYGRPRSWIQGLNQTHDVRELMLLQPRAAQQGREVACSEQIHVFAQECARFLEPERSVRDVA